MDQSVSLVFRICLCDWSLVEAPGTAPGSEWAYYEGCLSP